MAQALKETSWPGRFEVVSRSPLMILDGAHNPHAIKALLATLEERFTDLIIFPINKPRSLFRFRDLVDNC